MARADTSSHRFVVEPLGAAEVPGLLCTAPLASWQQFPAYSAAAAQKAGAVSRYLLVKDGSRNIALCNLRLKQIPYTEMGIGMVAQGPVMLTEETQLLPLAQLALCDHLSQSEKLTLRFSSPVMVDDAESLTGNAGFQAVPASQYETFLINLDADEETLRANLNGKWRTDLRRGEKCAVEITRSSDPEDFRKFQPLLTDLAATKGFDSPYDANFFATVAERAIEPENIALHLATNEGRLIGGHIGAYCGDVAVYILGATNDEGRNLRASYLLQWAAIDYAKQCGQTWYDLGGIDAQENPNVFRFKKRMGGQHYLGPATIEAPARWPAGPIIKLAENLYSRMKR